MNILGIQFSYNKKLETELCQTCLENRESTEIMENDKFDCRREKNFFQNFSNI